MSTGHGYPPSQRELDEFVADERHAARLEEFHRKYPHTRKMTYLEWAPLFYAWLDRRIETA